MTLFHSYYPHRLSLIYIIKFYFLKLLVSKVLYYLSKIFFNWTISTYILFCFSKQKKIKQNWLRFIPGVDLWMFFLTESSFFACCVAYYSLDLMSLHPHCYPHLIKILCLFFFKNFSKGKNLLGLIIVSTCSTNHCWYLSLNRMLVASLRSHCLWVHESIQFGFQ